MSQSMPPGSMRDMREVFPRYYVAANLARSERHVQVRDPTGPAASVGDHLARQRAPELAAFEVAAVVARLYLAPVGRGGARPEVPDYPWLQDRDRRGAVLSIPPQCRIAAGDDETAPAGQRRLVHPALGAVGILHQPPDLEFALYLHRQLTALVDPLDRIAG